MGSKFVAGVAIALCTTCMNAAGLTLQKLSHIKTELDKDNARREGRDISQYKVTRQKKWLIGLALMGIASLLSLAVFALVGQSVASSFAAITIVYNLIFSRIFLHEIILPLDIAISILMIIGTVMAVVFGSKGSQQGKFLTLDDILNLWQRGIAIATFIVVGLLIIFNTLYIVKVDQDVREGVIPKRHPRFRFSLFLRTLNAGLFSGFVGMLSKAVVTVFASAIGGNASENLGRFEPWLFLVLLPTALAFQVYFLNDALRSFSAKEAVPLYQSMVVVCGVTFGWLIFDEVAGKTTGQIIGFIIGILFVVTGILSLLFRKKEEAVVLSVSESAARVSAAVTLMADVARLRRVHSSPGDLRLYKDAQLANRTGKQLDFGLCRMRQLHVPLYSPRTTRVEARLVATQDADCRPVSPRRLLKAPQPEILTPEDARRALSDRPRVAQALLVDALLPGSTALLSEPYRNRRFKATLAAAEAAALVEQPSVLADLREEEDLRRARFATFAFPLGMPEVPQSPAADVTSVPVRHDAVQRSATLARHYASIRNLVMPTEGMARSITDVRERLQHRHKYSSLRLNAFSTDVGMATPTELGALPASRGNERASPNC